MGYGIEKLKITRAMIMRPQRIGTVQLRQVSFHCPFWRVHSCDARCLLQC